MLYIANFDRKVHLVFQKFTCWSKNIFKIQFCASQRAVLKMYEMQLCTGTGQAVYQGHAISFQGLRVLVSLDSCPLSKWSPKWSLMLWESVFTTSAIPFRYFHNFYHWNSFPQCLKSILLDNYNKILEHTQQQTFIFWNKKWALYSQIPQLGNVYDTQHLTCQQPH